MVSDRATAVFTDPGTGGDGTEGVSVKVCPSIVTIHSTGVVPVVTTFVMAEVDCCKELLPLCPLLLVLRCAVRASSNIFPAMPPPGLMQKLAMWPSFWQLEQILGGLSLHMAATAVAVSPDCVAQDLALESS
jgi:hypothetical protein